MVISMSDESVRVYVYVIGDHNQHDRWLQKAAALSLVSNAIELAKNGNKIDSNA